MSSPRPHQLMAGSQVRSLRPALCPSTATGIQPEGKVMPHTEAGSALPRQPKTAGFTKTWPQPPGKVGAYWSIYIHMTSFQGERQKFPCFPHTICGYVSRVGRTPRGQVPFYGWF